VSLQREVRCVRERGLRLAVASASPPATRQREVAVTLGARHSARECCDPTQSHSRAHFPTHHTATRTRGSRGARSGSPMASACRSPKVGRRTDASVPWASSAACTMGRASSRGGQLTWVEKERGWGKRGVGSETHRVGGGGGHSHTSPSTRRVVWVHTRWASKCADRARREGGHTSKPPGKKRRGDYKPQQDKTARACTFPMV
jgi:hypothetical protein